jgi:hypothetical protein
MPVRWRAPKWTDSGRMWRRRLARGRGSVPLPRAGSMPARQRAGRPHHDFQRSGLSPKAFAQRHGLGVPTLGRWLAEARATYRPTPVVFREVKAAGVSSDPAIRWAMEVEGASGLTVRCREALSVQDLITSLRGSSC